MISTVIEGGIILAKTLRDPAALGRQLMMQRSYCSRPPRDVPRGGPSASAGRTGT